MEGVPPVPARTGTALSSTAAPASNEQHVVGLPLGRVDAPHLPRGPVHLLDSSPDANRTAAVAGVLDLLAPAPEAVPRPLERLQQDRRVRPVAQGPEVRQVIRARVLGSHPRQPSLWTPASSRPATTHSSAPWECPDKGKVPVSSRSAPRRPTNGRNRFPCGPRLAEDSPARHTSGVPNVACTCCMC